MEDDLRTLMDDVSRLIGSIGHQEVREAPAADQPPLALFDRCRGLFSAVYLLAQNGGSQEAMLLARPLLTDSLALEAFAEAKGIRRSELVIRWELASISDLEGTYLEAQAQGRDMPF